MAIASLSFAGALPVYSSIGSNGTLFANNGINVQGNVAINTNGAPAASGRASLLTSSLAANGLSYSPGSAVVNGDQVTVYYNLTGNNDANAATDETALQTLQAGDQGAALTSGLYGTGVTITPEGSQTDGDTTVTAYDISTNGPVNNTIGTVNQQTAYSVSTSSDGSSLSLDNISALGNGLKVIYQLADAPPASTAQPAAQPINAPETGNTGLPASLKGITTIGDLLASANGLSFSGTLTGALQAQSTNQSTGNQTSAGILASILNPNLNLSPSTPLQITDFINNGTSAFPTSAPANPYASNNSSSTQSSGNNFGSDNTPNDQANDSSDNQGTTPVGVYTDFADVGTSNIRGGNLNTVA